jgi:methylenetetrahydrofolate reductase (NADPH)
MRIDEILASGQGPIFSFEFFPPKTPEGEANLYAALDALRPLEPAFVSVTWGAGGSTREKTIEIVTKIRQTHGLEAMAHFTCVGATVDDLHDALRQMRDAGIDNVLALRGDPPAGEDTFVRTEGGLGYGGELARLVAESYDFCVVGACYPEVHQEAVSREDDLAHAKEKVDAGACVLITQLFYDNRAYYRFVADARAAGIEVPIVPGIMPVTNIDQIKRITAMCGAYFPPDFVAALEDRRDSPEAVVELGVSYATLQCAELLASGAPGIHFYTLNRSPATRAILSALKLQRPWERRDPGTDVPLATSAGV